MSELGPEVMLHAQEVFERAVTRMAPDWLRPQSEDLVQTCVVKLLRGSNKGPFNHSYLWRLAHSVIIDELRRRKIRSEVSMSPSIDQRIVNSADLSPETVARGGQVGAAIVAALETLPEERRAAVTRYLQGMSVPDIAAAMGCKRKKASNLTYRGLADLRAALEKVGITP